KALAESRLKEQRRSLAWCVDVWLSIGDVREDFTWADVAGPGYDLRLSTMFSALAHQLARRCMGTVEFARCQNCGSRLSIARRLKEGQKFWCSRLECV